MNIKRTSPHNVDPELIKQFEDELAKHSNPIVIADSTWSSIDLRVHGEKIEGLIPCDLLTHVTFRKRDYNEFWAETSKKKNIAMIKRLKTKYGNEIFRSSRK